MQQKSEVPIKFKEFKSYVESETGKRIKSVKTDNGGEFINGDLTSQIKHAGIELQRTPPYSPQLNGVAERCNRTIIEMIRSMLYYWNCPLQLWGGALRTSQYLLNRRPRKFLSSQAPIYIWSGIIPTISNLKMFGCTAYSHRSSNVRKKLAPTGKEFAFIRYTACPKVYRLLDVKTH